MTESQKLDEWIQIYSQKFRKAQKPIFRDETWIYSELDNKLSVLLAQAQKQATYARMVERGQVPKHLRTERTTIPNAT